METLRKRAGLALTVLVTVLIVVFSLEPGEDVPTVSWLPFADKAGHFLAYAALGFSLTLWKGRKSGPWPCWPLGWAAVLGAAMEFLQPSFGRTKDAADFLADMLGAVWGVACFLLLLYLIRLRLRK